MPLQLGKGIGSRHRGLPELGRADCNASLFSSELMIASKVEGETACLSRRVHSVRTTLAGLTSGGYKNA